MLVLICDRDLNFIPNLFSRDELKSAQSRIPFVNLRFGDVPGNFQLYFG